MLGKIHMPSAQAVDYHLLMLVADTEVPISFLAFEMCALGAVTQKRVLSWPYYWHIIYEAVKPDWDLGTAEASEGEERR